LVGAENDRPSLEVRFRSDGHPPFTEREREIHLNGTSGVILKNPDRNFDPGFSSPLFNKRRSLVRRTNFDSGEDTAFLDPDLKIRQPD
jgi:hypothetical protein